MSDFIPTSAYTQQLGNLNIAGFKTTNGLYCHADDLAIDVTCSYHQAVTILGIKGLVAIDGPAVHEAEGLEEEAIIPRALGWQIGDTAAAFADALLANGILPRWLQGQTVVDLKALAPLNLFSDEQTEALLKAITIIRDCNGKAFTPLGTFSSPLAITHDYFAHLLMSGSWFGRSHQYGHWSIVDS